MRTLKCSSCVFVCLCICVYAYSTFIAFPRLHIEKRSIFMSTCSQILKFAMVHSSCTSLIPCTHRIYIYIHVLAHVAFIHCIRRFVLLMLPHISVSNIIYVELVSFRLSFPMSATRVHAYV